MTELAGNGWAAFIGLTLMLAGSAALAMGRALARNGRARGLVVFYAALLGLVGRFLEFALFDGTLLSPVAYLLDTAVLALLGLLAFQATRAHRMVAQYPWLFERTGPFTWRAKPPPVASRPIAGVPDRA